MEYNLILVFKNDCREILMLQKNRGPYPDKFNFIGGKIEPNESKTESAFREMKEETGLTIKDFILFDKLNSISRDSEKGEIVIHVFYGRLRQNGQNSVKQIEDEPLKWFTLENIILGIAPISSKANIFAGDGEVQYLARFAYNMLVEKFNL